MFCAKCGKQIEDDSTFCPFCGQQVGVPVVDKKSVISAKSIIKDGVKKSSALQGILSNKKVWGTVLALAAVILVVSSAVKLIGGTKMKSVPEKLFDMSWEEYSKLSEKKFKDLLEDEGILFESEERDGEVYVKTKTTSSFLGGDCLFGYVDSMLMPESVYTITYESEDAFKEGRKLLEGYLNKEVIKKAAVLTVEDEGRTAYVYPVEVSKKNADYINTLIDYAEDEGKLGDICTLLGFDSSVERDVIYEELNTWFMYKFTAVTFVKQNNMTEFDIEDFPRDNIYTDYACEIRVTYSFLREEEFLVLCAVYGHDAISGKEIDLDKFKSSVDEKLVREYLNKKVRENPESREDLEKDFYTKLYMMEKHDLDMGTRSYLKTKEEKKLWYIRNFSWDTDTQSMMDFSEYRNSSDIYCAVEFNYDSSKAEYFESELDKALYLADRNYKLGTGDGFESNEEKRLWFMENYSYDTSSGKVIEKEIVDALIAYQKYYDQVEESMIGVSLKGALIYLNDDNIPECILIDDFGSNSGMPGNSKAYILSYINDNLLVEQRELLYYNFYYTPRNGIMYTKSYGGSAYYGFYDEAYDVIKLSEQFERIGSANYTEQFDDLGNLNHKEYKVDSQDVDSIGLENYISSLGCEISVEFSNMYSENDKDSSSFLDMYDALRTTKYQILAYEFTEFNLSDGILTFSSDGAARYGQEDAKSFSYSFPVAENCTWGYYHAGENYPYEESDYENMKDLIESDMELYAKDFENYGDIGYWDSPASYYIIVTDNEVVDVRVVYS